MKSPYTTLSILAALLLSLSWISPALAADANNGKALHDENCNACHAGRFGGDATKIYTRPDRRKKSYAKLHAMVAFCNQQVGTQWFDDEVNDVTAYLNKAFYHFEVPK